MKNEIKAIIDKAERALKSAGREISLGNLDFACSQAYFAVMYLVQGVLLLDGHSYTYHRDIMGQFSTQYIQKKVFEVEILKHIKYLAKRRELADFSFSLIIYSEEANQCMLRAKNVHLTLTDYLKDKLFKIGD
jgi:uncharacterized protein (UPF0332 family)